MKGSKIICLSNLDVYACLRGKTDKNLSGELEGIYSQRNIASQAYNHFMITSASQAKECWFLFFHSPTLVPSF